MLGNLLALMESPGVCCEPVQSSCVFTDIFNMSLAQSTVPHSFKSATIVPVPKHSAAKELNDFCPVALTPSDTTCTYIVFI